jgi:transposase
MTDHSAKIEVITSVQRRRRWNGAEKMRMVEETYEPEATVSGARRTHRGRCGRGGCARL